MTVTSSNSSVEYTGNGATTVWPWNGFRIDTEADLQVVLRVIATGIETILNPALYSVVGIGTDTGSVTYPLSGSPLAATHKLRIQRVVSYVQELDILNQDGFKPDVLERQLDRMVMQTQQLARAVAQVVGSGVAGVGCLPTTGGIMTGDAEFTAGSKPTIDYSAGNRKSMKFRTAGLDRWDIGANAVAESGGNAGSDYELRAFDDAGVLLAPYLTVTRSTGKATFANSVAIGKQVTFTNQLLITTAVAQNDVAIADAALVNFNISANVTLTGLAGGTPGRMVTVVNDNNSSGVLTISTNDGASSTNNRIMGNGNLVLTSGASVTLIYNSIGTGAARWAIAHVGRANASNMESATTEAEFVTPLLQHRHPKHPKAWAYVTVAAGVPTLTQGSGVSGITDNGVGDLSVTWTTAFSSAQYSAQVSIERAVTTLAVADLRYAGIRNGGRAAGSCRFECWDGTAATAVVKDPAAWDILAMGDN